MISRCHKGLFLKKDSEGLFCKHYGVKLPNLTSICMLCKAGQYPLTTVKKESGCPTCRQRKMDFDNSIGGFRFSVVVVARDEGLEVEKTVLNLLACGVDEVVLIDDASSDNSCKEFTPQVILHRNKVALGPGICRNIGGDIASGEVIGFFDAHMESLQSLRPFAKKALDYNAFMCATYKPLYAKRDFTYYGGRLVFEEPHKECFRIFANNKKLDNQISEIHAVVGAAYAIRKDTWLSIGKWIPTLSWGYNEQAMSMKAWFAGVPMYVDYQTEVRHMNKERFNWEFDDLAIKSHANRLLVNRILFEDQTFEDFWVRNFKKKHPLKVVDYALKESARHGILKLRDEFRKIKQKSDAEFFASCVKKGGKSVNMTLLGLDNGN
jgi:glycosyltransferase involved in cell wall biosynthesis